MARPQPPAAGAARGVRRVGRVRGDVRRSPLLDGLGNMDELRTDYQGGLVGLSLRFFDPATRLWSIYWTDTRRSGLLEQPVVGSFSDGIGIFECDDTFDGRPDHRSLHLVRRDCDDGAVGAVVLGGRWRDLGDELDGAAPPRLSRPFRCTTQAKRDAACRPDRSSFCSTCEIPANGVTRCPRLPVRPAEAPRRTTA